MFAAILQKFIGRSNFKASKGKDWATIALQILNFTWNMKTLSFPKEHANFFA